MLLVMIVELLNTGVEVAIDRISFDRSAQGILCESGLSGEIVASDERPFKGNTGIQRVVRACSNSCAGLASAWRNEAAFRQEVVMAVLLIPIAFVLTPVPVERAMLIAPILLVMVVELLNSCVEAAIDRISLDHHPLSKHAKDVGSAAVFMALLLLASVWLVILVPRYISL